MNHWDTDLTFDQNHIWHPYSKIPSEIPAIGVKKTQGSIITLADDSELIDGMSSWWSAIHGYNQPEIVKAMHQQLDTMPHIMFGGLTHQPAIELAQKIIELTPPPLDKIFFVDSGSVAVEVAIKMALQYWISQQQPHKNKLITVKNGYHGDTFATMAVCDPENGMHQSFNEVLTKHYFAPAPQMGFAIDSNNQDINALRNILENEQANLAAMIIEPIVQGAGGMRIYRPDYLKQVRELCDEFNILLIVDEIATAFGRTGKLFACEWADITPDIMTLGKTLTGGHISLAATLSTAKISQTICNGNPGILAHGPTYMANPLACSAAIANIKVLLNSNWQENIKRIEKHFIKEIMPLKKLTGIKEVRVLGAIVAIELEQDNLGNKIQQTALENGVWIRPFGKLVYSLPAYNIKPEELDKLTKAIKAAVTLNLK
jgi:adenosylmethionine-8-amino-7-oxononanoate aminotransferase